MGAFIVNVNVRSQDRNSVERALGALEPGAAWLTAPKNSWITIYEERASTQDGDWIQELTESLSHTLHSPAIAFLLHDSDVLCYWLYTDGRLIDEFNSCPEYFGDDEETSTSSGGQPDVLLEYCSPGTKLADVQAVLGERQDVFVEGRLTELAELLGIDSTRALTDFRYIGGDIDASDLEATFVGASPPGPEKSRARRLPRIARPRGETDEDEDDDGSPGHPAAASADMSSIAKMMEMFGLGSKPEPSDPRVEQLVRAAVANDVAAIDKLVFEGADVNGAAPLPPATGAAASTLTPMMTGGGIPFPVTPLLAALTNKRSDAAKRLIELGADVHKNHPLLGTPVHAAALSGDPGLLRLILEAGGDATALNLQQQTPLQALQNLRQMMGRLDALGALGAMLTSRLKTQWLKMVPAPEGMDECERILRERATDK